MTRLETFALVKAYRNVNTARGQIVKALEAAKALPSEVLRAAGLSPADSLDVLHRISRELGTFKQQFGALLATERAKINEPERAEAGS